LGGCGAVLASVAVLQWTALTTMLRDGRACLRNKAT
jgi:hypothetical protein